MTHAISSKQEPAPTGRRFCLLFLLLLATLIIFPYSQSSSFGHYAFLVIGSSAILISVYAAKILRGLLVLAIVLAIPTLFHRIFLPKAELSSFSIFNVALSLVFDLLIVVVIFRHVFARDQPNSETIFGALCIYLLVGFSFASLYEMVAATKTSAAYRLTRTYLRLDTVHFDLIYVRFRRVI